MIGAYRENEVNAAHPLTLTLEAINKLHAPVNQISLQPLKEYQVNQLLADTLNCSIEDSSSLAELLTNKTGGNPFFLTQLLKNLHNENLFRFNNSQSSAKGEGKGRCWQWDIEQLKKIEITDNVVDLMVKKIGKLEENTQNILKLAACIGNQFSLDILSVISKKSKLVASKELQSALKEGLIIECISFLQ